MKHIFTLIGIMFLVNSLFAQPQVEWVWTDSALSEDINSIDNGLEDGFLISTPDLVVKLSLAGTEEWRTNFGAKNACALNDSSYVFNRRDELYFTNESGTLMDSSEIPFSGDRTYALYKNVVRFPSRVVAIYDYSHSSINHWGESTFEHRYIGQQQITATGYVLPYSHIGEIGYTESVTGIKAAQLLDGQTVYSVERGQQQVYKIFSAGEHSWSTWGETGEHGDAYWRGAQLIPNNNNEVVVAAIADGAGNPDSSHAINIQKYTSSGQFIWSHDLISSYNTFYTLFAADQRNWASGTLAMTSRLYGEVNKQLFLLGFDGNGAIEWTERAELDPNFEMKNAVFDYQGRVIVAGILHAASGDHLQAIAFRPSGNIPWSQPVIPETFTLFSNYPNPFNATTEISFYLPYSALTTLKVYDVLGRQIATLAEGKLDEGTHRVTFDGTGLASGVYIYRLESGGYSHGGFSQSHKMVLMK